ncbi:uncharacterized protein [Panulirus ornatus]|uniref:uncharacterized protein n=1 Tax=Panulirus ornatus TaxID=150431 RepID=UPI003A863C61
MVERAKSATGARTQTVLRQIPKRSSPVVCVCAWVCLTWLAGQLQSWPAAAATDLTTSGTDDLVMGATFGPGYSLLCGKGPPEAAAAGGGPSPSSSSSLLTDGNSHSPHDRHTSNLTSFTFCAFLRIRKSRTHSPLLTYTQKTWSATVDMSQIGVALQVLEVATNQVFQYFFEAKFPPGVWRHLCLQFHHQPTQAFCYVDDTSEPLAARRLLGSAFQTTASLETGGTPGTSEDREAAVSDGGEGAWRPTHAEDSSSTTEDPAGVACVGGGHRGTLEAEVAMVVVWRQLLPFRRLLRVSWCQTGRLSEPPYLLMDRQWVAEGNVTLRQAWTMAQLCRSEQHSLLVQPAGTYSQHVTVCQALGGLLLDSKDLTPSLMTVARGTNDSCVVTGGLVTWVLGSRSSEEIAKKVTVEDICPAQGTEGGMVAACVRQLKCSLCQVSSTVLYNLYGHDGRLFDHTYYSHNTSGHVMFRGLAGSEILRQEVGWLLRSSLHETQWLLPEAPVPVGRHRWSAAGEEEVVLTLTHCRTTQFACDDGQCVRQTDRCDDIVHCRDRSDEANCQVVERSSGYDPYYTPPPRPGEELPVDLQYHADVYSLDDVTTEGGVATMNIGMTLTWFDPRLKFLNLKPRVKNYFPCKLVWTPSVRAVSGDGEGTVLQTTDYDHFCYAYASNRTERPLSDPYMAHQADGQSHAIQNYVGVLASVPCHFHLQMYPFDFQLCNISFMLMNAPWTRVFRKAMRGKHVPYLDSRRVLLEYVLEEQTTKVGWFLQGTDNNTYFVLTYHLRRLYGYHVMNSFFPSLLMFFISYATFYFQLEDFTNRIMISLTAQLVLAALFTSTTQSSVKTPYLKLIDVWYAAIITFCFLIIIAQTIINVVFNAAHIPRGVVRAIGVRSSHLDHQKMSPVLTIEEAKGSSRVSTQGLGQPSHGPSQEVARRCNVICRVLILLLVVVFVLSYVMLALGVL